MYIKLGFDLKWKILDIEGKKVKLLIWDTAGQERLRALTKCFYKGSDGILLTYDVNNYNSLKNIQDWIYQIHQTVEKKCVKILVGNKCDLEREVSYEKGLQIAEAAGMSYFETSAKTGAGINEAFDYLAREMLKIKNPEEMIELGFKLEKNFENNTKMSSRCSC